MKYLSDYIEAKQSALFKEKGVFFSLNVSQFTSQKVEGVKYISVGAGMLCPTENVDSLVTELSKIRSESIAEDIKENGINAIIKRELDNHEAYLTGNIENTVIALHGYSITKEQVHKIY